MGLFDRFMARKTNQKQNDDRQKAVRDLADESVVHYYSESPSKGMSPDEFKDKLKGWVNGENDFFDQQHKELNDIRETYGSDVTIRSTNNPINPDLQRFLESLSAEEIRIAQENSGGYSSSGDAIPSVVGTERSLLSIGSNASRHKEHFDFAEKTLLALAEHAKDSVFLGLAHVSLAEMYFKRRSGSGMLEKCNDHCWKAIEAGHSTGWAYERLAINYEKEGNINEAIGVCELAINTEGVPSPRSYLTEADFKKRLERLKKKQSRES